MVICSGSGGLWQWAVVVVGRFCWWAVVVVGSCFSGGLRWRWAVVAVLS